MSADIPIFAGGWSYTQKEMTELFKHIARHDHQAVKIIAGIETVDHPTDAQLVAHARSYFHAKDRMWNPRL